ncbi:MAG TPA: CBS domain-containing protein [Candidatus Paceibacterota bacterium]|nr:CBS domain-containing protein [Verrucomicrobiota bacterium]HRY49939.1 CBS domain-containing protein [Candidatus Paceibacterota bacterium]
MSAFGIIAPLLDRKGHDLWSITPDAHVSDAIQLMADKNIGALVVMEGDQIIGVISERDYTRKVFLKGKTSKDTAVREIMLSPALCIAPSCSVDECMRIMTDKRVRHLPVVENNKVVGMVSIGDLVNWIISAQKATIHHLENYISGSYPA